MRFLVAVVTGALAACGQPDHPHPTGDGDRPYPRLASYHLGSTLDNDTRALLAQAQLAILDAELATLDPDALTTVAARNPALTTLAYLMPLAIPRDADPSTHPLADARFARIPTTAWVLDAGSTTIGSTSATDTRIRVADPALFHAGGTEPTFLLLGDEHVQLLTVEADELVVSRGIRSTATTHAAGTTIAPHRVASPGTWALDIANTTWRDALVADAVASVSSGAFSGIALGACVDTPAFADLVTTLHTQLPDVPVYADTTTAPCAADSLDGIITGRPEPSSYVSTASDSIVIAASGAPTDTLAMRLALATTLLGDGTFAFDDGTHHTSPWFDEYDGAGRGPNWLGHPQGPATRVAGGAYVRTFTRGLVIANPTSTPLSIPVPPGYRKLDGTEVTASLIVNAHDGALLAH